MSEEEFEVMYWIAIVLEVICCIVIAIVSTIICRALNTSKETINGIYWIVILFEVNWFIGTAFALSMLRV